MERLCQFESDRSEPPLRWIRLRVWDTGAEDKAEIFELGEPVRLGIISGDRSVTHIYWIEAFQPDHQGPYEGVVLRITEPESGLDARIVVRPLTLRKLPDMVRIAVEASRRVT